jgi:hypothetical protein
MTRARALKSVIRARIAKTGERYTTARRHVLSARTPRLVVARPAPRPAAPVLPAKGSVSDATARARTGHGLDHWFAVLDAFDAVRHGHTAAARHLYEAHQVPGWYAQGITVAYERRGVRGMNQRCDGAYEVSATMVVAAATSGVVAAISDARQRARWTRDVAPALAKALAAALRAPTSKGFVVRADGQARYRYAWGGTTVQFYVYPKPGGKSQVVVTQSRLASAADVEARRAEWRDAWTRLAEHLAR